MAIPLHPSLFPQTVSQNDSCLSFFFPLFSQEMKAVWLLRMARSLSSSKPRLCLKYSILESKGKHPSPWEDSFIKPDTSSGMLGWGKDLSCWVHWHAIKKVTKVRYGFLLWRIQNPAGGPLGRVVCINGSSTREQQGTTPTAKFKWMKVSYFILLQCCSQRPNSY